MASSGPALGLESLGDKPRATEAFLLPIASLSCLDRGSEQFAIAALRAATTPYAD